MLPSNTDYAAFPTHGSVVSTSDNNTVVRYGYTLAYMPSVGIADAMHIYNYDVS